MKKNSSVILACILILTSSITCTATNLATVTNEKEGSTITIKDLTPREEDDEGAKKSFSVDNYYPIEIKTAEEDGTRLLIKTFIVPKDTEPEALIEEGLVRRNRTYEVSDILKRDLLPDVVTKNHTQHVVVPTDNNEQNSIVASLAPSIEFSENGFHGTLYLDETTVTTSITEKKNYPYTIKDTKEFTSLDRNDPYNIPKTTVKNGLTLSLTDVDWTPMGSYVDDGCSPTMYRATAHYAGTAWGSKPTAYSASADYLGEITKVVEDNAIYSIVYEEITTPILTWNDHDAINMKPVGMAVIAASLLCGAIICVFILINRKKNETNTTDNEVDSYAESPMDLPDMLNDMTRETEDENNER